MQTLRHGDVGPAVVELRSTLRAIGLLNAPETTQDFDAAVEQAVRTFQQQRGLITDGLVGPATYAALRGAAYKLGDRPLAFLVSHPLSGDDVTALQERLLGLGYDVGRADGVFGPEAELALRNFQRDYGLTIDGICGAETIRALRQLKPKVQGGRPVFLREQERIRRAGPLLRGKRIVIDPGHGGRDRGVVVDGISEADLVWDLARRLEGRMQATGMEAILSRGHDQHPLERVRAQFANEANADLILSLHIDANSAPDAQGVACFHFGTGTGIGSTLGETLAGFIHRELVARTGMVDCRVHPRTWDILRLTKAPAVRIEIGYLTNEQDRNKLTEVAFRDTVTEGILIAVKRLYLLGENDQPTGTFTFNDLLRHEMAVAAE